MVKELELPKKKRKLGENINLKKQKQEKKGIKNRHRAEKETKPRTKESKKSLMLKRKVANEGTCSECYLFSVTQFSVHCILHIWYQR